MRPASRGGRCRPGCCRSAPSWSRSRACRSVPRRCRSAWPRHTSAPDLEALPLLAGPPLASAEPVEVECLPSGAEGRCRGAAGQPGHATPVRQTSRCCRCSPGRRWRAPSRSRCCRSAWLRRASAPGPRCCRCRPGCCWPVPGGSRARWAGTGGQCRGAAGQPDHATPVRQTSRRCRCWPGRRWRAPSRSRSSACLLALKAGAVALPVSLAAPHQCARPRGAAAARRAAAGERRAGRGRVPAFWR